MKSCHTLSILVASILVYAVLVSPARAQNDRIIDTPTGWVYLYNASASAINSQISGGMRPFSIKHVGSLTYDVVFVANSGAYSVSGTAMQYNRTPQQLSDYLSANNRRILDLTVFDGGSGNTRMTAITVPNSGSTHTPAWGWLYNTSFTAIANWMSQNPSLRLIDLDVYRIGSTTYYSAVAVHNSGNNQQGWWYYDGISASQVSQFLTQNNARLVQLEVVSPGVVGLSGPTFAVVMVSSNPGGGWWYSGLSTQQVSDLINQNGARITALTRYTPALGNARWAVAMVDNVNAQTRRMRSYIGSNISNGTYGFRLKQVGGPVLASLNENFVYEPASMLKIVHASYAIRMCSLGNDDLTNMITVTNRCTTDAMKDACPSPWPNCNPGDISLSLAISQMMQISHNSQTRVVEERYGRTVLNAYASFNAGPNTQINHTMGCGPMTNQMTVTDAVNLYERIANGTLFNTAWRAELFTRMTNAGFGGTLTNYPTLFTLVNQEAAATSLSSPERIEFRNAIQYANKGGGYGSGGYSYKTEGAWARLPFKQNIGGNWTIVPREYAIAAFIHQTTSHTGADIVYNAKEEILREQVQQALQSWVNACDAPTVTNTSGDKTAPLGGSAQFSVVSGGSTYDRTFQWQREHDFIPGLFSNITNEPGRFSGATTSALGIFNIQPGDARRYRVRITNRCGTVTSSPMRLTIASSCYANCDGSTIPPILNVDDFVCFINAFAQASQLSTVQEQIDHYANCDGSTTQPVLNVEDFTCFMNAFAAGCP